MKFIEVAFLFMVACGTISCEKECEDYYHPGCDCFIDELTFGHFYGECGGEGCIEIFRLQNGHLYEDTKDLYPGGEDFYNGDFSIELSKEKYDLVKSLYNDIPEQLFDETDKVLGNPDGGDWGGIYFEIKTADESRFWLLDQMDSMLPAYNEFVDKINEKIAIINQ